MQKYYIHNKHYYDFVLLFRTINIECVRIDINNIHIINNCIFKQIDCIIVDEHLLSHICINKYRHIIVIVNYVCTKRLFEYIYIIILQCCHINNINIMNIYKLWYENIVIQQCEIYSYIMNTLLYTGDVNKLVYKHSNTQFNYNIYSICACKFYIIKKYKQSILNVLSSDSLNIYINNIQYLYKIKNNIYI